MDSIFLAKVIGLSGLISTLAVLIRYKKFIEMEGYAAKNPVMMYLSGFLILIAGVLLIVGHQIWTRDWRVIITVIGWLVLVKGVLRIFFPEMVRKLMEKKRTNRSFLLGELLVLIVSLYLTYQGFIIR